MASPSARTTRAMTRSGWFRVPAGVFAIMFLSWRRIWWFISPRVEQSSSGRPRPRPVTLLRSVLHALLYTSASHHRGFQWVLGLALRPTLSCSYLTVATSGRPSQHPDRALVVVALMIGGPLKLDPKFWGVVSWAFRCSSFSRCLDRPAPVTSLLYRPFWHLLPAGVFVLVFFILGFLAAAGPPGIHLPTRASGTLLYVDFAFFPLHAVVEPRPGVQGPSPTAVFFSSALRGRPGLRSSSFV